jgi:serpin B
MAQYDQPEGYTDNLTDFFHRSICNFLSGEENQAYSPVNVYLAMAMLAETTGGNSRQQILDLFGVDSIEALRTQASHVWNAHYSNDGKTTLTMANSLWLDQYFSFHQSAADNLAQYFYASTFHGDLGTDAVNRQLQNWLNENTGGLLKEQAGNIELPESTIFALASTIYFSANWTDEFFASATYDDTFYTPLASVQTPFMHRTSRDVYYRGTHFGAISLRLDGSNRMWLILPDEGYTPEDILQSDEYLHLTMDPGSWSSRKTYEVHLSLPKFDVVQQQDLIQGMRKLGITDIFNTATSDFSPLSSVGGLYVSMINHAARVTIDETGCTAAAFTVIAGESAGTPDQVETLYFNLNRPFLFIVSSRDNLPLFAGIVKQP